MSAPAVDRVRPAPGTRQPGGRVPRRSVGLPSGRDAGGAIGRAYARRAVREKRLASEESGTAGRSQFVLLIMVLLGLGLVASLWLSTTAAADSYRLDAARQATRDLSERSEALRTEIASMQSAPSLAQAAARMGMVQVSDVARLVVAPDGSVTVVGVPKAAVAPPPPPSPVAAGSTGAPAQATLAQPAQAGAAQPQLAQPQPAQPQPGQPSADVAAAAQPSAAAVVPAAGQQATGAEQASGEQPAGPGWIEGQTQLPAGQAPTGGPGGAGR